MLDAKGWVVICDCGMPFVVFSCSSDGVFVVLYCFCSFFISLRTKTRKNYGYDSRHILIYTKMKKGKFLIKTLEHSTSTHGSAHVIFVLITYAQIICVAPFTQLRTCVIKIVTFKGDNLHIMW